MLSAFPPINLQLVNAFSHFIHFRFSYFHPPTAAPINQYTHTVAHTHTNTLTHACLCLSTAKTRPVFAANSARTTRAARANRLHSRSNANRLHHALFGIRCRLFADWSSLSLNNRQMVRSTCLRLSSAARVVCFGNRFSVLVLSLALSFSTAIERTHERRRSSL